MDDAAVRYIRQHPQLYAKNALFAQYNQLMVWLARFYYHKAPSERLFIHQAPILLLRAPTVHFICLFVCLSNWPAGSLPSGCCAQLGFSASATLWAISLRYCAFVCHSQPSTMVAFFDLSLRRPGRGGCAAVLWCLSVYLIDTLTWDLLVLFAFR